jgi:hypothetical protein
MVLNEHMSWNTAPMDVKLRGVELWYETLSKPNPFAETRANEYRQQRQQQQAYEKLAANLDYEKPYAYTYKDYKKPADYKPYNYKPSEKPYENQLPQDLYTVLGISKHSILQENPNNRCLTIKAAYRKTANLKHPDKGGTTEDMMLVNNAYSELKILHNC